MYTLVMTVVIVTGLILYLGIANIIKDTCLSDRFSKKCKIIIALTWPVSFPIIMLIGLTATLFKG